MAYPAAFETRSDSAVGGTIDDVSAGNNITASNHNILQSAIYELEKKLGLATIAKAATAGHFAMPHTTDGGPPTGNPDNGEGSMVWDSANNKLYVATADSATWAEIGGGGGATAFDGSAPAATNIATITVNDSGAALTIIQSGVGDGLAAGDGVAGAGALTHDTRTSVNPAGLTFINKGISGNITILKAVQYGTAQLNFTGANGGYKFTDAWLGMERYSIGSRANPSMEISNAGKTWANVNNPGDDTRITWGNTNGNTGFIIGASDATYEASIFLFDGGTAKPAYFAMCDDAGTASYLFFDTSGNLRKHDSIPTSNTDGDIFVAAP